MFTPTPPYSDATKTIFNQLKSGTAFSTQIVGNAQAASASLQSASASLTTLAPFTNLPSSVPSTLQGFTQQGGALSSFADHVQTQITDLPKNISLYTSKLSLDQGTGDLSLGNLCSGINDFFGSIMGAGQELLDEVTGAIGELTSAIGDVVSGVLSEAQRILGDIGDMALDAIRPLLEAVDGAMDQIRDAMQPLLDGINSVVDQISSVMNDITEMVQRELASLTDAISDLFNMSGAMSLQSLFSHPCARTLLGAVGTGGLIAALASS